MLFRIDKKTPQYVIKISVSLGRVLTGSSASFYAPIGPWTCGQWGVFFSTSLVLPFEVVAFV